MDPHVEHAFERYATRGQHRGADAVLQDGADRLRADPTMPHTFERRGHIGRGAAVVVLAAALGVGAAVMLRSAPSEPITAGGSPAPEMTAPAHPPTTDTLSPAEQHDKDRELEERISNGWVPAALNAPNPNPDAPQAGWIRVTGSMGDGNSAIPVPAMELDESGESRTPVYDVPDGTLLGYHYWGTVGFVYKEEADAPGFDIRVVARERGGCLPEDQECTREKVDGIRDGAGPAEQR